MNALANFVFDAEDGTPHALRSVTLDCEPWFVATDVAAVLGYRDAANMARNLDGDERGTHNLSTPGGTQDVYIISEAGLYAAILKSRKPEAKRFKKWVTGQVLPSIRKTGAYVEPGAQLGQGGSQQVQFISHGADVLVAADRTFRSAMRAARSAGLPLPRALRRANEICTARTGIDMLTELDAHDMLTPPPPAVSPAQAAQQQINANINAHMAQFMAALVAGQVQGADLPMLKTHLYRLYVWWCRQAGNEPASLQRVSDHLDRNRAYRVTRKRYINHLGQVVGPLRFVMCAAEAPPRHQPETEWLGRAVASAAQLLDQLQA